VTESRYARQPQLTVVGRDGTTRTLTAPRVVAAPPVRGTLVVGAGARLDLLAHAATGDTTRWWLLADANPWEDATRLERPGEILDLPDG
jgi:hypothetical protein